MAQKRSFDAEVVDEVSSKHPRNDGSSDEIISCNDRSSVEDAPDKQYDLGDSSIGRHEKGSCPETPRDGFQGIKTNNVPKSISLFHWATGSTSDLDEPPEELVHLPVFPGYFSANRYVTSGASPEDAISWMLGYPPRKRVPVGPEHQAEIPGWTTLENGTGVEKSEPGVSDRETLDINGGQLVGICVMPRPCIETHSNSEKIGNGRSECSCLDQDSIRCVQQHIAEARDKLERTLGHDTFKELGFYDMGEVVAEKWSEEEQQLFYEVVFSNPASLGKNFWVALSTMFPCRTKMEIVSYYFNVFMLRKRAQQNRCDHMSIDSDNDELQGSDDDGGDDGGILLEHGEEDSGVDSPLHQDGAECHQNGLHEDNNDRDLSDEANNIRNGEISARKFDLTYAAEFFDKRFDDEDQYEDDDVVRGENDGQYVSFTSSDSGAPIQGGQSKPGEWHEYIMDSSDAETWDGFDNNNIHMSCTKGKHEFLPTCSLIEEVFGDGNFESKTQQWEGYDDDGKLL